VQNFTEYLISYTYLQNYVDLSDLHKIQQPDVAQRKDFLGVPIMMQQFQDGGRPPF